MRSALLVLLALPASALAQTAGNSGTIVLPTGVTGIGRAQCTGTPTTEPKLHDEMTLDLTWTVKGVDTSQVILADDVFRLYAATTQQAAGQTSTSTVMTSCATNASGTAVGGPVGSDITGLTSLTATETFHTNQIATAASAACTATTSSTLYLCVQWLSAAGAIKGFATGTLMLDLTTPGAPTLTSAGAGDGVLHLRCSASGGGKTFVGKATRVSDATDVHYSGKASTCSDVAIQNLTNGQAYSVVVFGISAANNPSAASAAVTGTPIETDDFWDHYRNEGGEDSGGCSTTAGAAGLLGALSLLVLRRRKP